MPIPVWVLLGFAAWTLLLLFAKVEVYRRSRILTGRAAISGHVRSRRTLACLSNI
jgi:hypothetical protein